jgi:XTP/dITP diphosphohydrolase
VGRPLLVATTNAGKLREVASCLESIAGLELRSLADLPPIPAVAEDAPTFSGNAALKAIAYSRAAGTLTLADDSGLCVDALGGAPGVTSARFGTPDLDDAGRCRHLLTLLKGVPEERRGAHFECALALAEAGRLVAAFEGRVAGRILAAPRGTNGFGYDPVFLYPPSGRSFAEMPREEKSMVSHRGRALAKLRDHLAAHPELLRG